jgi:hypothetical protein
MMTHSTPCCKLNQCFNKLLKKAICGVTLILALLDGKAKLCREPVVIPVSRKQTTQPEFYLTGQVIAAYPRVRLVPQDFGRLASGHF